MHALIPFFHFQFHSCSLIHYSAYFQIVTSFKQRQQYMVGRALTSGLQCHLLMKMRDREPCLKMKTYKPISRNKKHLLERVVPVLNQAFKLPDTKAKAHEEA